MGKGWVIGGIYGRFQWTRLYLRLIANTTCARLAKTKDLSVAIDRISAAGIWFAILGETDAVPLGLRRLGGDLLGEMLASDNEMSATARNDFVFENFRNFFWVFFFDIFWEECILC